MATGTYAPDPDLHIVDQNGVPVSGGLIWTYIAGTTTPIATYTDVGLTVPNSNPIVAGSDGRFVAFLAGGNSYKFVYETPAVPPAHGAVLATRDNILAVTTIVPGTGGGVTQTIALSGTVNDLALITGCSVLYCTSASPLTITGLSGGVPGQRLTIVAMSGPVALAHMNAGSLAANRLLNWASSAPTMLATAAAGYGTATYVYDAAFSRWDLTAHEQAAWITPAFAAGDYAGFGGTWTVTAGSVAVMKYRLSGRTLTIIYYLNGTTIAGAPTALVINNGQFGGYSLAGGTAPVQLGLCGDTGSPYISNANATQLAIAKIGSVAFVVTANGNFGGAWSGEVT